MGMYSIKCPICGTVIPPPGSAAWTSAARSVKASAPPSRWELPRIQTTFKEFKENYLRERQTVPRSAVEGDIGNWLDARWGA